MMIFLARYWPHLAILLAIAGAAWYLDHRGYQRARAEAELAQAREAAQTSELRRQIETGLTNAVAEIDRRLAGQIATIDRRHETIIRPTVEREISREPRLSDPAAGLPDGVRAALNEARRPVPAAAAGERR